MLVDDRPAQRVWIGPEWRDDPRQGDWRGYFDDVVDVICPDAQSRGPRYGYGAGPRADQDAREGGRHVARHGKGRRGPGNRNGVAALTAAAVVGTGVGAGVLGVVPFMAPTTTSPGVTTSAHAPAGSALGSGASAQHHTGYVGKHRKAASSAPAHLGTQTGSSPAGSAPSSGLAYAPTSPSSAAGSAAASHQGGTSSSSASSSAQHTSPQSSSPAPQGGSGTGTGSGTPASTGTSTGGGSGSTSSATSSGGQGLVGGVVGGVTGLVGGLLG
jgi:hypothetical protein